MPLAFPAVACQAEPIPGYRLRQRLGAGGYGEVWAADAPGGLVKAIKFVYGQMDEARAAREFKSLNLIKGVRHPFLLSLERIEVVDGQLLIVSELADASLKECFELCLKAGQIGIQREALLDHLRDAADALDYMNSQHGLQHLDVKPENLLLVGGRIKVADFGLVKDIQEAAASMMGGLTPIYAPPEVFDARPSRRSDQYSLAIVYQEMLTGVLPFPGQTAAQLAVQHLTAKPRLESLPAADQPVIERALSKDPEQRFGSCREMVEALQRGRRAVDASPWNQVSHESGSQEVRSTAAYGGPSATALVAYAAGIEPLTHEHDVLRRLESTEQAAAHDSAGRYEAAEQVAQHAVAQTDTEHQLPPAALVDLPPLEADLTSSPSRPTLFLGIGGLAGRTLQRFRHRLHDRCSTSQLKQFSFLLLDTDARELAAAAQGEHGARLKPEETLALPIRKSAEYRHDSPKYLDWLSRRWLFNIPRSQQTEGIRPFGRLAFVDHSEDVLQRLRGAISQLLAEEKSSASEVRPRIIILGSSAGGAASGMVLDVVFAVRQMLDEQQSPGTVDLLLLHGTGRQPAAQELAAVNSFALLTELNQFFGPSGYYPGDASCGLKSRPASEPALENMYLVHLGQEMGADKFLAACDRVAEYLLIDSASPAGSYLNACRKADRKEPKSGFVLRTFGLGQIGFSDEVVNRGAQSLCRAVVLRWFGEPKAPSTAALSARISDLSAEAPASPTPSQDVELKLLASGQARGLGLDVDILVQRFHLLAAEELGGRPESIFQRILRETVATPNAAPPVEKWFAASARFLGALGSGAEPGSKSLLQSALLNRMPPLVSALGEQLREWLLGLTEQPAVRVFGAQWCEKWFRTHLKSIKEKVAETRVQISAQLSGLEQNLSAAAKTRPKAAVKGKDPATSPETLFLQHCQLRMYQMAADTAVEFVQGLASYVAQAHDYLHDLGRDLKHLATQYPVSDHVSEGALDAAALAQLESAEEASASALDRRFQEAVFSAAGFRTVLQGGPQRLELFALLQQQARQAVLQSLGRVDLLTIIKEMGEPGEDGKSKLGTLIARAQPWIQRAGGNRRLLFVGGQGIEQNEGQRLAPSALAGLISSAAGGQVPAVIPAATSQVVFCYELGNVPLSHAAALLIDHRPQFAQTAARLHTRTDVTWRKLPL